MNIRLLRTAILILTLGVIAAGLVGCGEDEQKTDTRVQHLLQADPYPRLEIHVDYVEDRRYRTDVADRLTDGLSEIVDKPQGIEVVEGRRLPPSAPDSGWTSSELRQLVESRAADLDVSDDTIDVYTLFVDGEYADGDTDATVLGIAWANQYVVMFGDEIERACQSRLQNTPALGDQLCERAELTIWRHEIGHVLGLVGTGAPVISDHADPEAPSHCRHDDCVMYRAFRGPGAIDVLRDRFDNDHSVPDFDSSCRADLDAARSGM